MTKIDYGIGGVDWLPHTRRTSGSTGSWPYYASDWKKTHYDGIDGAGLPIKGSKEGEELTATSEMYRIDLPQDAVDHPGPKTDWFYPQVLPSLATSFRLLFEGEGTCSGWAILACGSGAFNRPGDSLTWRWERELWRRAIWLSVTIIPTFPREPPSLTGQLFAVHELRLNPTTNRYEKIAYDLGDINGADPVKAKYAARMLFESESLWSIDTEQYLSEITINVDCHYSAQYDNRPDFDTQNFLLAIDDTATKVKAWNVTAPSEGFPRNGSFGLYGNANGHVPIYVRTVQRPPNATFSSEYLDKTTSQCRVFFTKSGAIWQDVSVDRKQWTSAEFYKPDDAKREYPWLQVAPSGTARLLYCKTGAAASTPQIMQTDVLNLEGKKFGNEVKIVANGSNLVQIADSKTGFWIFYWGNRQVADKTKLDVTVKFTLDEPAAIVTGKDVAKLKVDDYIGNNTIGWYKLALYDSGNAVLDNPYTGPIDTGANPQKLATRTDVYKSVNAIGAIFARYNPDGKAAHWSAERTVLPVFTQSKGADSKIVLTDPGTAIPQQSVAVTQTEPGKFLIHWVTTDTTMQHTEITAHSAQFGRGR